MGDDRNAYILSKIDSIHDSVTRLEVDLAKVQLNLSNHTSHDEVLDGQIVGHLKNIHETMTRNTDSLEEHMRRTQAVETLVEAVDKRLKPLEDAKLKSEVVRTWQETLFSNLMKILVFIGTLGAAIAAIKKYI